MEKEQFISAITEYSSSIKVVLSEEQKVMFYNYMNILLEWNQKINLTTITKPEDIIIKHFIDSLTVLKYIKNEKINIIDIGTGAGFPGIPIKIVNDLNNITLLDSLNKRIIFLQNVINELKLKDIVAVHSRAEEYIKLEKREIYDIAVSRAVANMSTLLEYLLPYVKINGICICMKGPNIEEELENSKKALSILGGKVVNIDNFELPDGSKRNIIIVKKIKNTPMKYPRINNKPLKEPIK